MPVGGREQAVPGKPKHRPAPSSTKVKSLASLPRPPTTLVTGLLFRTLPAPGQLAVRRLADPPKPALPCVDSFALSHTARASMLLPAPLRCTARPAWPCGVPSSSWHRHTHSSGRESAERAKRHQGWQLRALTPSAHHPAAPQQLVLRRACGARHILPHLPSTQHHARYRRASCNGMGWAAFHACACGQSDHSLLCSLPPRSWRASVDPNPLRAQRPGSVRPRAPSATSGACRPPPPCCWPPMRARLRPPQPWRCERRRCRRGGLARRRAWACDTYEKCTS